MFPRTFIGFDHLLGNLDADDRFPPYNIVRTGDDRWNIDLAVAGYSRADLTIEQDRSSLVISADPAGKEVPEGHVYIHRGIAHRRFSQRFRLGEHVRVEGATLENGILRISLVREVPENLRPRQIAIAG